MKTKLVSILALCAAMTAQAQVGDPVLMTVGGKPVTKGEFEYSYNKNAGIEGAVEKKTVAEYAEMFLNYKLKVAAAEAAHLDTLSSFRTEFAQYREMQLTPELVDSAYIDSVAQAVYQRTADQLHGQDMLRLSHILIMVPQNAPAEADKAARAKADSLYKVIRAGGDFAALAKQYSQDPGSGAKGGELPWIGPGMTIKEFETAAYGLKKAGDITEPVHTAVGYHIIRLDERKQLESFAVLKPQIKASLKRQGIEEASSENHIKRLIAAGGGRVTRATIMDSVLCAKESGDPNLKYLISEYHDGLLLYEISKREVWDAAAKDTVGLERVFKDNKKAFAWQEPHYKGFVVYAKDKKALKAAVKVLKKSASADWRKAIKENVNKDSLLVRVSGPYLVKKGENANVDRLAFGVETTKANAHTDFPVVGLCGKKMSKPKNYTDVKSAVVTFYQKELEDAWVARLRQTIPFSIDKAVLSTVEER